MGDWYQEPTQNFLADALVLLKQNDPEMKDLLPFIMRYDQMIQSFTGVSLPQDAIDGPMNSVAGFLSIIQLAYQKLIRSSGGESVKTYKEESSATQGTPATQFCICTVTIDDNGIQDTTLLHFGTLADAKKALKAFNDINDENDMPAAYRRFLLLEACCQVSSSRVFKVVETFIPVAYSLNVVKTENHIKSVIQEENLVGVVICYDGY